MVCISTYQDKPAHTLMDFVHIAKPNKAKGAAALATAAAARAVAALAAKRKGCAPAEAEEDEPNGVGDREEVGGGEEEIEE